MEKKNFLLLLDEVLELESGTLTGNEQLENLEEWDSLAKIGFIALIDEHFGFTVPPQQILKCKTVMDLMELAEKRMAD